MKMNSTLSGNSGQDEQSNLAHQFYWYIPHPSLPYVDSNLKDYGRDHYKQQPSQNYNQAQNQQTYSQPQE